MYLTLKGYLSHADSLSVGVGGHVLGGGYGMASHSHGLALDWLIGATVILANSTVVHTSGTENADLFWAIRGGGSAFGIVAEFEFNTFAAPTTVTYYAVNTDWWTEANLAAGLKAVQNFAATNMPTALNMRVVLDPGARRLEGVYYGSGSDLNSILSPLLGKVDGRISLSRTVSWLEGLRYYAYSDLTPPNPYKQVSSFQASPYY